MKTALLLIASCCVACAGRPIGPPNPTSGSNTPTTAQIDPSARFYWADSVGFTGAGKAIEILGTGVVHGWGVGFDPTANTRPPDYTGSVSTSDVADLFARFAALDLTSVPHGPNNAECAASGVVTDCADCDEQQLNYADAGQVLPELAPVWAWFTDHPALAMYSPGDYCTF